MLKQLTVMACLGLSFVGCDDTGVTPVQLSTGGTGGTGGIPANVGAGGNTSVVGGGATQNGSGGSTTVATGTSADNGTCLLTPTADTGWVDATSNGCKIQGAWYSYNDCSTSPSSCTTNQLPTVGGTGFPNTAGKMCTSGTTVAINGNSSTIWGAGIGLNLNQPTESETKNPISTLPHLLKGFSFKLSGPTVPPTIRVSYPTAATTDTSHFKEVTAAGDYTVLFTAAAQGEWVTGADAVALTAGDINAIQFQVVAAETAAVPFDFCIESLTALY